MKTFAEKILDRDFKKRFIMIAVAAAVMLAVSIASVAALCHTQISEAIQLDKTYEEREKLSESAINGRADGEGHEHDGKSEEPEIFDMVTPLPVISIAVLCAAALLCAAVVIFYWLSVMEWLYKAAVQNGLNRVLWPVLGAVFNILAVLALLIIVNDPKRKTA